MNSEITIICAGCGGQFEALVETVGASAVAKPCKCVVRGILGKARKILSDWPLFHIGMSQIVDMIKEEINQE